MIRGQILAVVSGSRHYRVLIISNDEFNDNDLVSPWGLTVQRTNIQSELFVPLAAEDPLSGAVVDITRVMRIDRTAVRENYGFVSNATLNAVEYALRNFLNLP